MRMQPLLLALIAIYGVTGLDASAAEAPKEESAFAALARDGFEDDAVVIDFDRSPSGERLTAGDNLAELYASKGCIFEPAIKDSKIVVADYKVHKDNCAANLQPLFEGGINIRFIVPGSDRAGCVHSVGFYTAYVTAGGVALAAYDGDGKLIGEVRNVKQGRDFMGMQSKIPIARIEIKGVPMVDKDFAIDDLIFDTPKRLSKMPQQ